MVVLLPTVLALAPAPVRLPRVRAHLRMSEAVIIDKEDILSTWRLTSWVESEGGFVGSVAIQTHGSYRGLFATEDVASGTILASVPKSCLIFAEDADLQPEWGLTLAEFLTANLAGAEAREEATPYLAALPAEEPLLADWDASELAELQSPRLVADAQGQKAHVEKMLSTISPWVAASPSSLARAERMVRSRALTFESGWKGTALMAMVPLVDLANHRTPLQSETVCFRVSTP